MILPTIRNTNTHSGGPGVALLPILYLYHHITPENTANALIYPYRSSIESFKLALTRREISDKTGNLRNLAERVTHLFFAIVELIPIVNYVAAAIDHRIPFSRRQIQIKTVAETSPRPTTPKNANSTGTNTSRGLSVPATSIVTLVALPQATNTELKSAPVAGPSSSSPAEGKKYSTLLNIKDRPVMKAVVAAATFFVFAYMVKSWLGHSETIVPANIHTDHIDLGDACAPGLFYAPSFEEIHCVATNLLSSNNSLQGTSSGELSLTQKIAIVAVPVLIGIAAIGTFLYRKNKAKAVPQKQQSPEGSPSASSPQISVGSPPASSPQISVQIPAASSPQISVQIPAATSKQEDRVVSPAREQTVNADDKQTQRKDKPAAEIAPSNGRGKRDKDDSLILDISSSAQPSHKPRDTRSAQPIRSILSKSGGTNLSRKTLNRPRIKLIGKDDKTLSQLLLIDPEKADVGSVLKHLGTFPGRSKIVILPSSKRESLPPIFNGDAPDVLLPLPSNLLTPPATSKSKDKKSKNSKTAQKAVSKPASAASASQVASESVYSPGADFYGNFEAISGTETQASAF